MTYLKSFSEFINEVTNHLNEQKDLDQSLSYANTQVARIMQKMLPWHLKNCMYQITPWGIEAVDKRTASEISKILGENNIEHRIDEDTQIFISETNLSLE